MNGLLIVDKPAGVTSFSVVQRVRRMCGVRKVGHAGTLDPFATGVLLVCTGRATRLLQFLTATRKTYEATVRLGTTTDTMDLDGQIMTETHLDGSLDAYGIEKVLGTFRGECLQVPPMFSALKHKGKRLYAYAREGVEVAREPRKVSIHRLELTGVDLPEVSIRVECSKGTYIRTLAADIGAALGVGGHLASLRRTSVGEFGLDRAVTLERLEQLAEQNALDAVLIPPHRMLADLPRASLGPELARRVRHGGALKWREVMEGTDSVLERGLVQLFHGQELLAIAEVQARASVGADGELVVQPRIVLAADT